MEPRRATTLRRQPRRNGLHIAWSSGPRPPSSARICHCLVRICRFLSPSATSSFAEPDSWSRIALRDAPTSSTHTMQARELPIRAKANGAKRSHSPPPSDSAPAEGVARRAAPSRSWLGRLVTLVLLSVFASCADDPTVDLTDDEVRQLGVAVNAMVLGATFVMLLAEPLSDHEVDCDTGIVEVTIGATKLEATLVPKSCSITTPPFANPFTVSGAPSFIYTAPVAEPAAARGTVAWIHADGREGTCSLDLRFAGDVSGEICGKSVSFNVVGSGSLGSGYSP